jgi:hypothetical protein
MALRSRLGAPQPADPLDIPLRPLTIRSVGARQAPRPVTVADRVRGEFVEMRGFSPTVQQAARLFDLPADACRDVLAALEREGFLTRTPDGRYRLQA